MGRYDKYLAGLGPVGPSGGKYDSFVTGLPRESSTEDIQRNAQEIEPGVYGETNPTGQKILENAATAAAGYSLPGALGAIPGAFKSAGKLVDSLATRSGSPVVEGLLKNTKKLGPSYDAQNAAIGVTRRVPVEGGKTPKFKPPELFAPTKQPKPITPAEPLPGIVPIQYPKDTGSFLNYADAKLKGLGDKISPQELLDWQVKLQTDISNGTIPKIDPDTKRITTIYQQAADLLSRTKNQFNKIAEAKLKGATLPKGTIPTRAGLNTAYGISAKKEAAGRLLKKGAKYALGGGLAYELGKRALGF